MDTLVKIGRGGRTGRQVTITIPAELAELIPDAATHISIEYDRGTYTLRPVTFAPVEMEGKETNA